MIQLKRLLYEDSENRPADAVGNMIDGLSKTDKWQYWKNNNDDNWYTKRKKSKTWLDMRTALFDKYNEEEATRRWNLANERLDKWVSDHPDEVQQITVSSNHIDQYDNATEKSGSLDPVLPEPEEITYHDVTMTTKNVELDDAVFRARTKRNSPFKVVHAITAKDGNKYYLVQLPHRFWRRKDYDVYVKASDVTIYTDKGITMGKPKDENADKFDIYRPYIPSDNI